MKSDQADLKFSFSWLWAPEVIQSEVAEARGKENKYLKQNKEILGRARRHCGTLGKVLAPKLEYMDSETYYLWILWQVSLYLSFFIYKMSVGTRGPLRSLPDLHLWSYDRECEILHVPPDTTDTSVSLTRFFFPHFFFHLCYKGWLSRSGKTEEKNYIQKRRLHKGKKNQNV